MSRMKMRHLPALILTALANSQMVFAQSNLLENVKRNPQEAIAMCRNFESLNKKGISSSSAEALKAISHKQNLSKVDAEILSIYVIGMHCPHVR